MIEYYLSSNNEMCYSAKTQTFHQINTPCFAMEPCDCLFAMVTLLQSLFNHLCTVQQNRKVPAGLLAVEHTASASDQSPIFCRLFF